MVLSFHTYLSLVRCFLCNQVLLTEDPKQKALLTHHAWQKFRAGAMPVGQAEPPLQPARPVKPQARLSALTIPQDIQHVEMYTLTGRSTATSMPLPGCSAPRRHTQKLRPDACCCNCYHLFSLVELLRCTFLIEFSSLICSILSKASAVLFVQLVPPKQVPTPKQSPLPLPVYM